MMKHENSLDGLRAFAVIAVVFYHAFTSKLPGGWAGVDVFFVLSGYLITTILNRELQSTGRIALGRFYFKRLLRLGPAFVFLLIFAVCFAFAVDLPNINSHMQSIGASALYLMNWSSAFHLIPGWILAHTWSLAAEQQFYLLWPLAFAFIAKKRPGIWLGTAIAVILGWRTYLVLTGADASRTSFGFDAHSDGLLIGCLIAVVPTGERMQRLAKIAIYPSMAVLLLFVFLMHINSTISQSIGLTIPAICAAILILGMSHDSILKDAFSSKVAVYTGRISYGWYLWHYPLLLLVGNQGLLSKIAMIAASYVMAAFSFHFVEMPFLRWKDRLSKRSAPQYARTCPNSD